MTAAAAYSAGAVARRLGVAVTTLRTWHQRYGMGPSLHEPGHHRRYTEQDIERLEVMQRLIVEGVAPNEAARWALLDRSSSLSSPLPSTPPDLVAAARGLHRAALRLDAPAVRHRVAMAVHDFGVVMAWDGVIRPVLTALGDRHVITGGLIEVEHLLSGCVSAVFGAVPRPGPNVPARILLACADEEQHSLPLEALGAALAAGGIPTRMLGARVPPTALATAVRRTGPAAVLVWSQLPTTGDPVQFETVLAGPRRPIVVAAAGPGWATSSLPPGVARPATLTDALVILTAAIA